MDLPPFSQFRSAPSARRLDVRDQLGEQSGRIGEPGAGRLPELPHTVDALTQSLRGRSGSVIHGTGTEQTGGYIGVDGTSRDGQDLLGVSRVEQR